MRKHAAAFLVFWVTLWWAWQLFVGEWGRYQWVAGAIAATVGAAIGEIAVTHARSRAALRGAIVKSVPAALGMVFVDFVTVMRLLATRREGVFRTTPFEHPDDIPHRAWDGRRRLQRERLRRRHLRRQVADPPSAAAPLTAATASRSS